MDKKVENIVNETADKLNSIMHDNKNISWMVIAVDCTDTNNKETRCIQTAAKCGGTVGSLAAGLVGTAIQTKAGKQLVDAIRTIMERGCFQFEDVNVN